MAKKSKSSPEVAPYHSENEWRWRAEDDLRTYSQWMQIKKDPKRLANMKRIAKEKMAEMKAITDVQSK
jgi:hypothetical protein